MNKTYWGKNKIGSLNPFVGALWVASVLLITLVLSPLSQVQGADWYDTSWSHRREITLSPATPQSDFQVSITLTTAVMSDPYAHINPDGSDIRFTGSDGTTLQDYWIESYDNTGTSRIWIEVKASGTSKIYMYYGNPGAAAASDGDATFPFFDHFEGSAIDGNKWEVYSSGGNDLNVVVSGSVLHQYAVESWHCLQTKVAASNNSIIERRFKIGTYADAASTNRNRFYVVGVDTGAGFDHGIFDRVVWSPWQTIQYYWGYNGTSYTGKATSLNTWMRMTQKVYGTTYKWTIQKEDGTVEYSNTQSATISGTINPVTSIGDIIVDPNQVKFGGDIYTDWIFVRGYTSSAPTTSVGSEESGGGGGLYVDLESFTAVASNGQVGLSWSTASEVDSAGFNILRSDSHDGPYDMINYALIPARGDSFTGGHYTYTDFVVANGNVYYYMLEEFDINGGTHPYGPVAATPGIISLLSPTDGGGLLLNDPSFEIMALPNVKRMALYVSSSQALKGKETIRVRVKRGKSQVKLGKRARKRLAKLASRNAWTLYCGVYGALKGERGLKLLSNVNRFNVLLSVRADSD